MANLCEFARERAEKIAPGATWEEPDLPVDADSTVVKAWLDKHPKSFWGLKRLGARLVVEGKWAQAKDVLEKLKAIYPEYVGPENAYLLLADRLQTTVGSRGRTKDPRGAGDEGWRRDPGLLEVDGDGRSGGRLAGAGRECPAPAGRQSADTGPISAAWLVPPKNWERLDEAIGAYRALALLDDTDPARVHYHLASLLRQSGKPQEARREVLKSLEQAPRFREAHQLLLELLEHDDCQQTSPKDGPFPIAEVIQAMTRKRRYLVGRRHRCWPIAAGVALAQPGGPFRRQRLRVSILDDRRGVPDWKVDEHFKKDVFTFVRIEYDSMRRMVWGWRHGRDVSAW